MARLDYDEEMEPSHGIYGSIKAEFEVQRTIKRADVLSMPSQEVIGPIKVDNKGIINGLRRGERECIKPRAGDADLWIKIWEDLHLLAAREMRG